MLVTGQIAVVMDGTNFISKGIQWVTNSDVYHVVVAISETECIGAEPGGVRIRPISYWYPTIWSQYDLTDEQRKGIVDWVVQREHRPYNYIDDALIGTELLIKRHFPQFEIPTWLMRHFDNDKSYECAQLADAALTKGGGLSVFDDGRWPGEVYPGSFQQLFIEKGWATEDDFKQRRRDSVQGV